MLALSIRAFDRPWATATWSPLVACHTWEGALATAWSMTSVAEQATTGMGEAHFFHEKAATLLAPALYAAASQARSISDVVRWIYAEAYDEVAHALKAAATPTP